MERDRQGSEGACLFQKGKGVPTPSRAGQGDFAFRLQVHGLQIIELDERHCERPRPPARTLPSLELPNISFALNRLIFIDASWFLMQLVSFKGFSKQRT